MSAPEERIFLRRALALARRMRGLSHPNPTVGAVIARGRRIVAQAAHPGAGGPHAEALALQRAGRAAKGADLYVTLEPCRHFGRTPPCTEAIVAGGIRRVVILNRDINKIAAGGAEFLRRRGVAVEFRCDLPEAFEAARLNSPFFKSIYSRKPFVSTKWAVSADGVMSIPAKSVRWTGEEAHRFTHRLRERVDAVMVGVATVIADNPSLDCRLPIARKQPYKVILDSRLRTPPDANVFKTSGRVVIFHTAAGAPNAERLRNKAELVPAPPSHRRGGLNLAAVMSRLCRMGILHVLLEAGPALQSAMMRQGLVDEIILIVAPKLAGAGIPPLRFLEQPNVKALRRLETKTLGPDVLVRYLVGAGERSGLFEWEEAALCLPE